MNDYAEKLQEDLRRYGLKIGDMSRNGDTMSKQVITYYNMWHKCPGDNMAMTLTRITLERWLISNNENVIVTN